MNDKQERYPAPKVPQLRTATVWINDTTYTFWETPGLSNRTRVLLSRDENDVLSMPTSHAFTDDFDRDEAIRFTIASAYAVGLRHGSAS